MEHAENSPWVRPACRPGSRPGCDTPWQGRWRGQKWRVWGAWWSRRSETGPPGSMYPASLSGCGRPRHPFEYSTVWWSSPPRPPPRPTAWTAEENSDTSVGDDINETATTFDGICSWRIDIIRMRTKKTWFILFLSLTQLFICWHVRPKWIY